jgi:UDP-glucose 4-epimerase
MARLVAERLASQYRITGIDSQEPDQDASPYIEEFVHLNYTGRRLAELFRQTTFDALVHVGRLSSTAKVSWEERFEQNVYGTKNLLALGLSHGVKKFVVLSTHLVYGAARDTDLYLREDAPLRAGEKFPELRDAIELDYATLGFIWRHRRVETILLRPVHIVGRTVHAVLSTLLQRSFCPLLLGYDPPMQVIHESDVARAIEISVCKKGYGVFNVAGEGVLPLSAAIEIAGAKPLPIPPPLASIIAKLIPIHGGSVPPFLVNYAKYPTIVSDAAFRKTMGWEPQLTITETLGDLAAARAGQ